MVSDTGFGLAGGALGAVFGGPLGAGVGSFLGTALSGILGGEGGLFGGGVARENLSAGYGLADGRLTWKGAGTKGGDINAAKSLGEQVMAALNKFADALGGTFVASPGFETNVGKKDTGTFVGANKISNSPSDVNAIIKYILNRPDYFTSGSGELLSLMNKSFAMGSTPDQVLQDVTLGGQILGVGPAAAQATDPLVEALEELDKQFKTMTARASALGLPMDKVNELYTQQRSAIEGAIHAMQAGFQSLEQMTAAFDTFIKGQQLGPNSSLTPTEKLGIFQKDYGDLLAKAQGGDLSVTPQLLVAADNLITVARGMYASSVTFAMLESSVLSGVKSIAKAAGVPGYWTGTDSAAAGLAWVGEKGPELVNFRGGERVYSAEQSARMSDAAARDTARQNAQMLAINAEQLEEMRQLTRSMRVMAKQFSRNASFAKVMGG